MTPSARIVIADRGGFRSGVLYDELPSLMQKLHEDGKGAIAYHTGTELVVGESKPNEWWARDRPPLLATHLVERDRRDNRHRRP